MSYATRLQPAKNGTTETNSYLARRRFYDAETI